MCAVADARRLAFHCLELPVERRALVLGVLQQLGVPAYHVTDQYPRLQVAPRDGYFEAKSRDGVVTLRQSWQGVVELAREEHAAIAWPFSGTNGTAPLHFEHLIGLPLPPLVWLGAPLRLDLVETRPNCCLLRLHAGDQRALLPDVLRYLLGSSFASGVLSRTPTGDLVATRRAPHGASRAVFEFETVVAALRDFRLISGVNARRILADFPWTTPAPLPPTDDLTFAIDTLGAHAGSPTSAASPHETLARLAPALLAIGMTRRSNGVVFEDALERITVHPWAPEYRDRTLREVVELANARIR